MSDAPMTDAPAPEPIVPETEKARAQQAIAQMTPEAYLELESALNSYADSNVLPEAGGIAFTEFVGGHGGVIHATARAAHPTRAIQMLLESLSFLKSLQPETQWCIPDESKGKAPSVAQVQAAQQQPVQQTAQTAQPIPNIATQPSEPQYVDVNSGQPVATQQAGGAVAQGQQVMTITKVVITPKPDARVDVEMWAPGHQYPDLRVINWTAQSVLENLVNPNLGWNMMTLQTAGEFVGNFSVTWENSAKLNTKGVPYKDVKLISLGA